MTECVGCGRTDVEFYVHTPLRCKECVKARNAKWRARNPNYMTDYSRKFREAGRKRGAHLWHRYGLTEEDFDRMLSDQGGGCAMCGSTESKGRGPLHVDHDHDTGRVRGLLCMPCNLALAPLDDGDFLLRAIAYLGAGSKVVLNAASQG